MNLRKLVSKALINLNKLFLRKKDYASSYVVLRQKALLSLITAPVILSLVYFYSIGRKRYFVRSDVIVRTASNSNNYGFSLSNIIGAGNQSSNEDAFFLQTFLESPQVLRSLEKELDFEKAYSKKGLDFYAGLASNAPKEKKYDYFRRQVSMTLYERSGILRIRTIGLNPETAHKTNLFLIKQAEIFVNELNQSIYKEQLEFLNEQVSKNAKKLELANNQLSKFQESFEILDAKSEAKLSISFISELESQLVKLKVELASIKRRFVDNNAPEIRLLRDQIQELTDQIFVERNLLVDPEGKNYNRKIIKMEELQKNINYASELYFASLKAAEKATVDSVQQQRFLAIISEPQIPEEEWRYWRHRGFFTTIAIFFIVLSLTKFLLGMADSHNN